MEYHIITVIYNTLSVELGLCLSSATTDIRLAFIILSTIVIYQQYRAVPYIDLLCLWVRCKLRVVVGHRHPKGHHSTTVERMPIYFY